MDIAVPESQLNLVPPLTVARPLRQTTPIVFVSPHSGRQYPPDFVTAARLDPLSAAAQNDLGVLYMQRGDFKSAEAALRRAAGLDPFAVNSHYNLGVLLARTGRRKEAEQEFARAQQNASNTRQIYARVTEHSIMLDGAFEQTLGVADSHIDTSAFTPAAEGPPTGYAGERRRGIQVKEAHLIEALGTRVINVIAHTEVQSEARVYMPVVLDETAILQILG